MSYIYTALIPPWLAKRDTPGIQRSCLPIGAHARRGDGSDSCFSLACSLLFLLHCSLARFLCVLCSLFLLCSLLLLRLVCFLAVFAFFLACLLACLLALLLDVLDCLLDCLFICVLAFLLALLRMITHMCVCAPYLCTRIPLYRSTLVLLVIYRAFVHV